MADIREVGVSGTIVNATVTGTTETIVVTSPAIDLPGPQITACIMAYCQLTTGGTQVTVTPRIRRGTAITSPLVGLANAEALKAAAGSTEPFFMMVTESISNLDQVIYSFSLQQAGGAGNGTALQVAIWVLLI
jgi:hypothetical protein